METLSKEFKLIACESIQTLKIGILRKLIEPFCMFSLSIFQSKGYSQKFFHQKTFRKMSSSIQTLIDGFKNVAFEKVEFECQDNSTLIELLPLLVNQASKSDKKIHFQNS